MKTKLRNLLIFSVLWLLASVSASANNVQVSQVSVTGSRQIKFAISWDNSWKLDSTQVPNNYDAVWVFIKFRETNSNLSWKHLDISDNENDHISSAYLQVETVKDKTLLKRVLLYPIL